MTQLIKTNILSRFLMRFITAGLVCCILPPSFAATPIEVEFAPVLDEIKAMIETHENLVPDFVVKDVMPGRIEQLFERDDVVKLPKIVRENGLIFAGLGSSLLTFEKPSDVIKKISKWFPAEVAKARSERASFRPVHLFGPYENWVAEPAAFISLWKCMPQSAWLHPERNPFARRLNDGGRLLWPLAMRQTSYNESDFGFCVRNRAGYRSSWSDMGQELRRRSEPVPRWAEDDITARNQAAIHSIADAVTPMLRDKFSGLLTRQGCSGTGPDDCVLIMRLWASLLPNDPELAAAIQRLESKVMGSPLPELPNPTAAWAEMKESEGQERFDEALRRAAFLRAKLLSVLQAPSSWTPEALPTVLRQMSWLRSVFTSPFVSRFYMYQLDYRNDPINPWHVFDDMPDRDGQISHAILTELQRLAEDPKTDCEVFAQWLLHSNQFPHREGNLRQPDLSLQNRYVLTQWRNGRQAHCIDPNYEWLRQQTNTSERYVLDGYLALLDEMHANERLAVVRGLTDNSKACFGETRQPDWLEQVCKKLETSADSFDNADPMFADPTSGDLVLFPGRPQEMELTDDSDSAVATSASKPLVMRWNIPGRNFRAGDGWWGLVCDTGCRLNPMRLTIMPSTHGVYDGDPIPSQILNWSPLPVSTPDKSRSGKAAAPTSRLLAVFKPIRSLVSLPLATGSVKTWLHQGMANYPTGGRIGTMEVAIPIKLGMNALLVPRLNRTDTASENATQLEALVLELRIGNRRQLLGSFDTSGIEGMGPVHPMTYLLWAGDLDGDGKLDLLIDFSGGGGSKVVLFLSTLATGKDLVGSAGSFEFYDPSSAGC